MPVIILVVIAIPSFKLLYYEAEIPARSDDQGDRQAVVLDLRISRRRTAISSSTRWVFPTPRPPRRASRACSASTMSSSCR
jgi:hypothetical protein